MTVTLNGETVDCGEARTISELIKRFELPPQSILVEHNGRALHRRDWSHQVLGEADRIELVRVAAGG
jgi:thiamine biosynthesis protein ThiS